MKYDLDPETRAVLAAVIAGEDVEFEYYVRGMEKWVAVDGQNTTGPLSIAGKGFKLRLKPRTIRIGEYDVPEPMRVAPESNLSYYTPNMVDPDYFGLSFWEGDTVDFDRIAAGVCHATKEAAITHGKALRSLTGVKP